MKNKIPYNLAEEAIKKVSRGESKLDFKTKGLLLLKQQNILISDDLIHIFEKLDRLINTNEDNNELEKVYSELSSKINAENWNTDYYNKSIILNKYLDALNAYLIEKYPLELEMQKSFSSIKSKTKISLLYEKDFKSISFYKLSEQIKKETNFGYLEICNILQTSKGREIVAIVLNTSIDSASSFIGSKTIGIIINLLKIGKLGIVIKLITDNINYESKIAGL